MVCSYIAVVNVLYKELKPQSGIYNLGFTSQALRKYKRKAPLRASFAKYKWTTVLASQGSINHSTHLQWGMVFFTPLARTCSRIPDYGLLFDFHIIFLFLCEMVQLVIVFRWAEFKRNKPVLMEEHQLPLQRPCRNNFMPVCYQSQ